jgi:hypothetical protein
MSTLRTSAGPNLVLWLLWILPSAAVAASFASLYLAVRGGDTSLPDAYHWEGQALTADEALQTRARTLGIAALLQFDAATGQCHVTLRGDSPALLRVDLTHPTERAADQHWILQRDATGYHTDCQALPQAHWWVQITDPAQQWQLRGRMHGKLDAAPLTLTPDTQAG